MVYDYHMESQVEMFTAEVISNGRITITDFRRRRHGVTLGSIVTVKLIAVDNEKVEKGDA